LVLLRSVQIWLFNQCRLYRDKKVVGVFVPRFRAPLQPGHSVWTVSRAGPLIQVALRVERFAHLTVGTGTASP
jgi:hypothetical protein